MMNSDALPATAHGWLRRPEAAGRHAADRAAGVRAGGRAERGGGERGDAARGGKALMRRADSGYVLDCRADNCAVGTGDACDASGPLDTTMLLKGHMMTSGPTLYGRIAPVCNPSENDSGLPYGEAADGRLVAVADVPRGIACALVCPECRARLVAKKGDVIRHHFAHESGLGCEGAYETMLHKLAKQIVADAGWLAVPPVQVSWYEHVRVVAHSATARFDRVELEVWQGGIRPDIVGYRRDRALWVEVAVTHPCGPEKIAAIGQRQAATVEIDLSQVRRDTSFEALQNTVLRLAPRQWLYHPKEPAALAILRADVEAQRAQDRHLRSLADEEARRQKEADEAEEQRRRAEETARYQANYAKREAAREAADADRVENNITRLYQMRAELLKYATKMLGDDDARVWMDKSGIDERGLRLTSPNTQTDANCRFQHWDALRVEVSKRAAKDTAEVEALAELVTTAARHFRSEERGLLWCKGVNPALDGKSPAAACVEPGGLARCLALLNKAKR